MSRELINTPTRDDSNMLPNVAIVEVVINDDFQKEDPSISNIPRGGTTITTSASEEQLFRPSVDISRSQTIDNIENATKNEVNEIDFAPPTKITSFVRHVHSQVKKSRVRHKTSKLPAIVLFIMESYERSSDFVWNTLEQDTHTTVLGKFWQVFIVAITLLTCLTFAINTEPTLVDPNSTNSPILIIFFMIECFALWIYILDYGLRLLTCLSNPYYNHYGSIFGRLRFIFSFGSLIDLVSTIPSLAAIIFISTKIVQSGFLASSHYSDTYALAAWRLVRLLRLFRVKESLRTLKTIVLVFYRRSADLMTSFLVMLLLLLIMSVVMYYVERSAQPDSFASILRSFYFTAITLFTVGYGDVVPKTGLGKFFCVVFVSLAFIFFSIPVSIFNAAFLEQMQEERLAAAELIRIKKERAREKQRRDAENLARRKKEMRELYDLRKLRNPSSAIFQSADHDSTVLDNHTPPHRKNKKTTSNSPTLSGDKVEEFRKRSIAKVEVHDQDSDLEPSLYTSEDNIMNTKAKLVRFNHKRSNSDNIATTLTAIEMQQFETGSTRRQISDEKIGIPRSRSSFISQENLSVSRSSDSIASMVVIESNNSIERNDFDEFFNHPSKRVRTRSVMARKEEQGPISMCPHCKKPITLSFTVQPATSRKI
jgi:voltage-gated potassium channel